MQLDLNGRRAVVTGASLGIGAATVRLLSDMGAEIEFCARNEEAVEELPLKGHPNANPGGRALRRQLPRELPDQGHHIQQMLCCKRRLRVLLQHAPSPVRQRARGRRLHEEDVPRRGGRRGGSSAPPLRPQQRRASGRLCGRLSSLALIAEDPPCRSPTTRFRGTLRTMSAAVVAAPTPPGAPLSYSAVAGVGARRPLGCTLAVGVVALPRKRIASPPPAPAPRRAAPRRPPHRSRRRDERRPPAARLGGDHRPVERQHVLLQHQDERRLVGADAGGAVTLGNMVVAPLRYGGFEMPSRHVTVLVA